MERPPSNLQRLVDFARKLGHAPTGSDSDELRRLLATVPLEELGFPSKLIQDPSTAFGRSGCGNSGVSYAHVFEDAAVSLGIFCFAAGAVIPLHNHPGMTVWSRLLFGDLHVRAYDLEPDEGVHANAGLGAPAALLTNRVIRAPCEPLIAYPKTGGNIHAFRAVTPCAVLDVLAPPYDTRGGRPCTYFQDPLSLDAAEGTATHLQERASPDEFVVSRRTYRGTRVV